MSERDQSDEDEFLAGLAGALGWREHWNVCRISPDNFLAEVRRLMREAGEEESNRDVGSFRIRTAAHVGLVPFMMKIDEKATAEEGTFPLYKPADKPPRETTA